MAELREAGRSSVGQAFRQMGRPPLRFESPVQEEAFLYVYCRHFAAHRRLALVLGLLAGVLFLALDLFVASDLRFGHALPLVIGNRIASILLLVLFLGLAVSARFEVSERYAGGVLFAAVVVGFLLNCRGFLIAPYPYDYMYFFMGMCIDIMFGFAMLRLQARLVLMQTALCLLAAGIVIAWNRDLEGVDPHVLHVYQVTAMSLLLTVAAIGCAVANQLEGNARAAFAYTGALAASNERLAARSEEIERLNLALRQAVERAQRESKARARVLASASHDLRQPLHALSLYSALLAANPAPETLREVGGHIDQIARSLGALLHGLLDLSQLASGHYVPLLHSVRLDELCRSLCDEFEGAAREKGLTLECRREAIAWRGDVVSFSRIVRNLMDNAIKYTVRGQVSLRLARDGDVAVLEVEDSGVGIDPDALPRIFEEFFQVGNEGRDRNRGIGLGLAIVHRRVELGGGEISVRSQPAAGSCFTLRMPGAAAGEPTVAAADSERGAEAGAPALDARVYIVDDEADILRGVSMLLRSWGCRSFAASGVEEAVRLFASGGPPDLMIVDLRLAGPENGVDLVKRLQAAYGDFPVLVATGETVSGALRGAREAGWPLLHKPIAGETLREAIESLLRRRAAG